MGTSVRIAWDPPTDLGGDNNYITGYKVELLRNDGSYVEETVNCDGSDAAIYNADGAGEGRCDIPMSLMTTTVANGGLGFL